MNNNYLMELITSNESLKQDKDYYYNLLKCFNGVIPEENLHNFYNNIKTLKVCTINNYNVGVGSYGAGGYSVNSNKIKITKEFLNKLKKRSQKEDNPEKYFNKYFNYILIHELCHMASSHYDAINDISYMGFDKVEGDMDCPNEGLNEGFTEILAHSAVSGTTQGIANYYLEELLVHQIIEIIGVQVFIDSYFGNLGIDKIVDELSSIYNKPEDIKKIFKSIEYNYQLRKSNNISKTIGNIQSCLISIYFFKLKKDISLGVPKERIWKSLHEYENYLINNQTLYNFKGITEPFRSLDESIIQFFEIKDQIFDLTKEL